MFSKIQEWAQKRIRKKLVDKLRTLHLRVYPVAKQGMFNYRCHNNCVQYAFEKGAHISVFECFYVDCGEPILHYVNYDNKKKKYLETTLGYRADSLEYYVIKEIRNDDWMYIHDHFDRSLDFWLKTNSNWFERLCLGDERAF